MGGGLEPQADVATPCGKHR